jgi:predicted ATPase/transcriptional regulator with XRE-family HTH domain
MSEDEFSIGKLCGHCESPERSQGTQKSTHSAMPSEATLGAWVKRRRKTLGLTQEELAELVACSTSALKKIEANQRRPSRQLALLLAHHLQIPTAESAAFLHLARIAEPAAEAETSVPSSDYWPAALTPLLGREQTVAEVVALLRRPEVRLVTLTGLGGVGKTRLGLHVAEIVREDFTDGSHFISLATLTQPALVLPTILKSLGRQDISQPPTPEHLQHYLRGKNMLWLLDNFEQVLAAAPEIAVCLQSAPGLKVLVTSRARLQLYGEYEFVVPPLSLPPLQPLPALPDLLEWPAVALFVQRAQAAVAHFELTPGNARAVAEICAQMDGMPLALELAAAHSKLLTPAQLAAQLKGLGPQTPLDWRAQLAQDRPARQQTLRQTMDWSYRLLPESDQALFRQLGVFVGGATLEAMQAVLFPSEANSPGTAWEAVGRLVDQSLLRRLAESGDGAPRFGMLETVREYALEQLTAQGELDPLRRRHAAYFAAMVETAMPQLRHRRQLDYLAQLEAEHDNLRAALTWSYAQPNETDQEIGRRLASVLWDFWLIHGYLQEGRAWLTKWLALPGGTPLRRAQMLNGASVLALASGEVQTADQLAEESWRLYQAQDETLGAAWALSHRGQAAYLLNQYRQAENFYAASLESFRALGADWHSAWVMLNWSETALELGHTTQAAELAAAGRALFQAAEDKRALAMAINRMGLVAERQQQWSQATTLFTEGLHLFQEVGDKESVAWTLNNLGRVTADPAVQTDWFVKSMRLFGELGNNWGLVRGLWDVARLAIQHAHLELAAHLLGAAEVLVSAFAADMSPAIVANIDRRRHTQLPAAAWEAGRTLPHEVILQEVLATYRVPEDPAPPNLTE